MIKKKNNIHNTGELLMGKIKIIFFDIDGTLLRLRAKELSEKTVEATEPPESKRIRLCIATGRTPGQPSPFQWD